MTPDSRDSANQEFLRNLYKSDLFVCAKELCGFSEANWRTHGDMIQALESDDERKLIVMPRGTFKCVDKMSQVYDTSGMPRWIKDVLPGEVILTWINGVAVPSVILAKKETAPRKMLRIVFRSGRELCASDNHPMLTIGGWENAGVLKPGNRVAQWAGAVIDQGKDAKPGHAWLLGMFIGDGSCTSGACMLTIYNKELEIKSRSESKKAGFIWNQHKGGRKAFYLSGGSREFLKEYDVKGRGSWEKEIPRQVWGWSLKSRREFIAGYFSCDGTVEKCGKSSFTTVSKSLAYGLADLLKTIGVFSTIRYYKYSYSSFYRVNVVDSISQKNFIKCPFLKSKMPRVSPQDGFWRSVPKDWRKFSWVKNTRKNGIRIDSKYDTSFTKFRKISKQLKMDWACTDEMIWDQIKSIEEYIDTSIDLAIAGTKTFITNGMITHNSSIGVVAYTIWRLINDPNLRILINSEVYTNSKNWIREISGVFKSKKFVDVFGDWEGSPWSDGEIIVKARTKNFKESSVVAGGVGTIKTGQHYDLILNDDLNSEKNSDTSEGRQKVIRFYRMQFSLLEPGKTMIVIGTRYAVDDVIGHIMEHEINHGLI